MSGDLKKASGELQAKHLLVDEGEKMGQLEHSTYRSTVFRITPNCFNENDQSLQLLSLASNLAVSVMNGNLLKAIES